MGTTGFALRIVGYWITQENYDIDYRSILTRWRRNSTVVIYDDGAGNNNLRSQFTIRDFNSKLIAGQPGLSSKIEYEILLAEAVRLYVDEKGANIISALPWIASSSVCLRNALFSSTERHTFTDSSGNYWIASAVSCGGTPGHITMWMSSNGVEWNFGGDLKANVTNGSSLYFAPWSANQVGVAWSDQRTLRYAEGQIVGQKITWNASVAIAGSTIGKEDNYYPYLHISSTGRRFISTNSGGSGMVIYDSTNGVTWTYRKTFSTATDPNRYSAIYESQLGSGPQNFYKRVVWHDNIAGLASVAYYGTTEGDYSNIENTFFGGMANIIADDATQGKFTLVKNPWSSVTSVATFFFFEDAGIPSLKYNLYQGTITETPTGPPFNNVQRLTTTTPKNYISASVDSASGAFDVYWIENGLPQRYNSVTGIQQSPPPFGSTSAGEAFTLNTPEVLFNPTYIIWENGIVNPFKIIWGKP